MAKDPAFLFYTSDFLTGTLFMTMAERGQYITILCLLHQHGGCLPIEKLEIVVGKIPLVTLQKLETTRHGLHSKRLTEESKKRSFYCKSRQDNLLGKKKNTTIRASHMNPHMENENEDENRDKERDKKELYAELVSMTTDQYDRLVRKFGKFHLEKAIFILNNYKNTKGKKYKSDYHAILSWAMDEAIKKFPAAAQQDGKKEEGFNREGLKKLSEITKGVFKG